MCVRRLCILEPNAWAVTVSSRRADTSMANISMWSLRTTTTTTISTSGGQKRRVSLAAALVHSPPLLILDEPTVGVDPLLRQSIWQHLVSMTKHERISVIITTHYIEEARLANVVGLMRNGRILAEASPDELMHEHQKSNLEDVFLKLCVTDSSWAHSRRPADRQRGSSGQRSGVASLAPDLKRRQTTVSFGESTRNSKPKAGALDQLEANILMRASSVVPVNQLKPIRIHTGTNKIELSSENKAYANEAVEVFSSEEDEERDGESSLNEQEGQVRAYQQDLSLVSQTTASNSISEYEQRLDGHHDYLAMQQMQWATRRTNALSLARLQSSVRDRGPYNGLDGRRAHRSARSFAAITNTAQSGGLLQWWKTLVAVTWKNYVRLRRNPPVLVFQFMLPAIQVILFCLCIGGEPFDVPVAIVNEEQVPKSSLAFLGGLNKKIIRQVKYDNLTSAMEAVRRGQVWGALHIPDKFSENLQSRLILGEEVTNETISNGTIKVYPDLTSEYSARE